MNRRFTIAGAVVLATGLVGWWQGSPDSFRNSDDVAEYTPRSERFASQNSDGQFEWREKLTLNVNTGEVETADFMRMREEVKNRAQQRASFLTWEERGPDNIGGRCRAILVDRSSDNIVWAGSVSGGLFKSIDAGNNWTVVDGFTENLSVSSIAQANDGTIYVGTGHTRENISGSEDSGAEGGGLFVSTDGGVTWSVVAGTENYDNINELINDPDYSDRIWMACDEGMGLKVVEDDGTSITDADNISTGLPASGHFESLVSTPNGDVMGVTMFQSGIKTYVSSDHGATWTDVSGNATANKIPSGGQGRIELAVSHGTNSNGLYNMYALCANNSGDMNGVYFSGDNGITWYEVAPPASGTPPHSNVLSIFGSNTQGTYDNIATVSPANPGRAFFGGIDIWEWNLNTSLSSPYGQFEQKTLWFTGQASPVYAHADQHEMKWDSQGNLYIGNDGGVGKSPAGSVLGDVWFPTNKGFNVTQYYYIAYSNNDAVMGGAQDNGTTYNEGLGNTPLEFREVFGGDGFACDISFMNDEAMFASSQSGNVQRSNDKGSSWGSFFSPAIGAYANSDGDIGSFYTNFRLFEDPNDTDAPDSVLFIPDTVYAAGDSVFAESQTFQQEIPTTTPVDLLWTDTLWAQGRTPVDSVFYSLHPTSNDTIRMGLDTFLVNFPFDTLMVQDPYQSLFVFGIGGSGGVFITREALRFSVNPFWWQVLPSSGQFGAPKCFEFSKDGDILYFGDWSGQVWRISGLSTMYATPYDTGFVNNSATTLPYTVEVERIYNTASAVITGLSVDKNDPGHVMISLGNFGVSNHVLEATNADISAGTANFSSIQGDLPSMPTYAVVMDRDDPSIVVVGTEMGIWATQDATAASPVWEHATEVGNVPTYDLRQNWRDWTEGGRHPGKIYAGTFGRGIWSTGTLLNVDQPDYPEAPGKFTTELLIYPNPMADQGQVKFELAERSDVQVNVYTLSGKRVTNISRKGMAAGQHLIDLEPGKLSNGTYLVEVVAGNEKDVSRFVVSK